MFQEENFGSLNQHKVHSILITVCNFYSRVLITICNNLCLASFFLSFKLHNNRNYVYFCYFWLIASYLAGRSVQFSRSVVSESATPWIAARQASVSVTISRSSLKPMSIESVMPSSHLSHPLLSPSPPAPNPSQHQSLFQWVNSLHEVAKVLKFQLQHHSFQRTPRTDLL